MRSTEFAAFALFSLVFSFTQSSTLSRVIKAERWRDKGNDRKKSQAESWHRQRQGAERARAAPLLRRRIFDGFDRLGAQATSLLALLLLAAAFGRRFAQERAQE